MQTPFRPCAVCGERATRKRGRNNEYLCLLHRKLKWAEGARRRNKQWYTANREVALEQMRQRRLDDVNGFRQKARKYNYGITLEEFNRLHAEQHGLCAICQKPETMVSRKWGLRALSVDHDHDTGVVRGLLCSNCNMGIGHLKDSLPLLRAAVTYLESRVTSASA